MKNQEGIKIELQKKVHIRICMRTSLFWLHALVSMSLCVALFIYTFPLAKWYTWWMALIKIHNIAMGGILCDDIMSERSKIWKFLTFNTSWLASLRTWYYFRLCFSFSCSGYDLILIKKSHTLKLLFISTKVFIKNRNWQLVVGNCGSSIYC